MIFLAGNAWSLDQATGGNAQSFLQKHCIRCHGPDREEGGLRIDRLRWDLNHLSSVDELQNILDEIVVDSMPPEGEPRPPENELKEVSELLVEHIAAAKAGHSSGGGRPVRRLTRVEYVNTLYDLLGGRVAIDDLPQDGNIGSFDTEATDLYTTDMHIEQSLTVARDAARRFIASRNSKPGRRTLKTTPTPPTKKGSYQIRANDVPPAGYQIARLVCWQKNPNPSEPSFIGPRRTPTVEITGTPESPQQIDRKFFKSTTQAWAPHPNVFVKEIEAFQVVNPQPFEFFESVRTRYGDRVPDAVARQLIADFVELMNRGRRVDKSFVRDLVANFRLGRQQGETFWEAMVEPMALSMCSIEAMFHFETRGGPKSSQYVSPVEMVNRVAFFLWRSAPDEELIRLAQSGKWYDPKIRLRQFRRMVEHEKFDRFLRDFTVQWLELDRQDEIAVDERIFRDFNSNAKESIKEETIQFVSHLVRENLPLRNLIDSDFMLVNNLMA
ncbi:DUF1592 domain-containing protein [Rhodopirellula sallentina]|uniref:Protein containing DUF1592 n=1 Tax=Rhodopirellula sallentina SM41 TaxID=1263870 RepID=M5U9Q8_9BACT|nr:DUF1592 domain-containing protein [Rhodopirellula sallentina]EMI52718.1 protein containing DUF1592 [Rhodopirellula sallentina SM41]